LEVVRPIAEGRVWKELVGYRLSAASFQLSASNPGRVDRRPFSVAQVFPPAERIANPSSLFRCRPLQGTRAAASIPLPTISVYARVMYNGREVERSLQWEAHIMVYRGHVANGSIWLDDSVVLPEGAVVQVEVPETLANATPVPERQSPDPLPSLPAWALGVIEPLSREGIYRDYDSRC
jgi:hypothetical protein